MKTYLTYAAFLAAANAVLYLVSFLTGLQTTNLETGQYVQWLGTAIFIVILFFGMREARDQAPTNKEFGYGNALLACLLISLFAGAINAVYVFIHFSFINTHFADYMESFLRHTLEAKNIPSEQIDKIVPFQLMMMKPTVQAVTALLMTPLAGSFFGLILAIFGRRPAAQKPLVAEVPPAIPPAA